MDTGLDLFTDISLTMFFILFIKKRAARLTFLTYVYLVTNLVVIADKEASWRKYIWTLKCFVPAFPEAFTHVS